MRSHADSASSGATQESGSSPDHINRSRSRSRASFVGANAEQLPRHGNRSSPRASFLGRPRQRVYQIYDDNQTGGSPTGHVSPNESRTVTGSLEDEDGFVFTDDDEPQVHHRTALNKTKTSSKASKLNPPAKEGAASRYKSTTATSTSASAAAAPIDFQKLANPAHAPSNAQQQQSSPNKQPDVEAQQKHAPKPVSRLSRIPYPIAHFLGYRSKKTEGKALIRPIEMLPRKLETLIWAWIGAMLGLGFVMITFSRWDQFAMSINDTVTVWTAPIVIGSFGASSVILYGTPASPLGQPKAFIGGHFLSALTSVCITKLFELNSNYNPNFIDTSHSLVWVAGGIATGTAVCVMILTDTIHPPGGATALLAATSPPVIKLGWRYLPVVLLSGVIMSAWAMLWMNLGRARYPHYWFWPPGHPNDQRNFRVKFPGFNKSEKAKTRATRRSSKSA